MISGLIEDIINVVLSRSIYAVLLFMIIICYVINMFYPKEGEEVAKSESEVEKRDVYDFERRIEEIESRKEVETESKSVQKDLESESTEEVDFGRFEKLVRSLESTKSKIEELKHQMAETKAEKDMVVRLSNDMLERIEKVTKSKSDSIEIKDENEINEKINALENWFTDRPKIVEVQGENLRRYLHTDMKMQNGDGFTICDNLGELFVVKPSSSQAESRPETSESSNASGDCDPIKPGIVTNSPEFRSFLGSIAQTDSD